MVCFLANFVQIERVHLIQSRGKMNSFRGMKNLKFYRKELFCGTQRIELVEKFQET